MTSLSTRERQKRDRKAHIFTTAMQLYQENGFGATTVSAIAEAARVSRGTVFNYYSYKELILIEHLAGELGQVEARTKAKACPPLASLYALFEELADYFQVNAELVLPLCYELLNPHPERSRQAFTSLPLARICRDYLGKAQAEGQVRRDFSHDRLARTVANTFFLTALQWAAYRRDRPIKDELKKALQLTLEGVVSQKNV